MLKVLYALFRDFGMDSLQLGIICFFGWKILTNHLKHLKDSIDEICKKMDFFQADINSTKERISTIEGKISVK